MTGAWSRPWRFTPDAAGRLSLAPRPAGGAIDLVLDGSDVVGYVVGCGLTVVEHLAVAGLIWQELGDPASPPPSPGPDPFDPLSELEFLRARIEGVTTTLLAEGSVDGAVCDAARGVLVAADRLRRVASERRPVDSPAGEIAGAHRPPPRM